MDFDEYQELAFHTDQFADKKGKGAAALQIPLLGIAGETGTLLAEFKKKLRDKESYEGFEIRAEEELGDILWYVANVASHLDLSLTKIAAKNLTKTQERWPIPGEKPHPNLHDADYPAGERLPRKFRVRIADQGEGKKASMVLVPEEKALGDELTNNAYEDDGYRFHDVFHLGHLAVLGWSPVVRKLLGRKRKSNKVTDEIEDGARAMIIEELIVAYVYSTAADKAFYKGVKNLDSEMLATIKRLVQGLEVRECKMKDFERAIMQGYAAFRHLLEKKTAVLEIDSDARKLHIIE